MLRAGDLVQQAAAQHRPLEFTVGLGDILTARLPCVEGVTVPPPGGISVLHVRPPPLEFPCPAPYTCLQMDWDYPVGAGLRGLPRGPSAF